MDIQIISASAGSGKTYRLSEFLEQVVSANEVRPDAILATTFTKKAAAELQERVRTRLLAAGLTAQAQQLSLSRIGTVNSVCSGLLKDFAFDLGISPGQKIIEEEAVSGVISRAMSRVIDPSVGKELWQLEQIFPGTTAVQVIESIIAKARANGIDSSELKECGRRSVEGFLELYPEPAEDGTDLDQTLMTAMARFFQFIDTGIDTTKQTQNVASTVQQLKSRMSRQKKLPWCEWLRLAKIKPGVKSKEAAGVVIKAAECHDVHPQQQRDIAHLITLMFELASKTLSAYQQYKREWGVVDFIDQEALTLQLLDMKKPAQILRGKLDLVLVDEFQDTSPIQLAIFLKLAALANKSVWVGDQKQAIYGFRDADPSLMDAAITGILNNKEPETLKHSWRSRPELVHSTSEIFMQAFGQQGFPRQRVQLKPAPEVEKKIPQGLSAPYECWQLQSRNKEQDVMALADAVRDFLDDPDNTIRDKATGEKRRAKGGDIAVLCRMNDMCQNVAEALEQQGVPAALARPGLLSCPECILVLAAVRLLIDPRDSLARAEIARLLDEPGDHDSWLQKTLEQPYAKAFDLELFSRLDDARTRLDVAGPLEVIDAAMETVDIRFHCLCWGGSEERLANLDSLRTLCVNYTEECKASGKGASPSGMLTYLNELETADRAVVQSEDTVQVLTWHKAKGLEWPVVVLFELNKVFNALPLGVNAVSDGEFCLDDPLKNRWLRYWPDPYAVKNIFNRCSSGAPFHDRLMGHAATVAHQDKEKRQELRLLYVGWTRARDKVVLSGRAGFLNKGILSLLIDDKGGFLLEEPKEEKAVWAGRSVEVTTRTGVPGEPVEQHFQVGTGYKPNGPKDYPPAFLTASSAIKQGQVSGIEKIGDRFSLSGEPDMQAVGEAIHTFFGRDNIDLEKSIRLKKAEGVLKRWQVLTNLTPENLVSSSDRLHSWINRKWPDAIWYREYPFARQQESGTIVSGFIDVLLEHRDEYYIIDHKSFPGSTEDARKKASGFAGQLGVYAEAVKIATGRNVKGCFIYLPVSALMLKVDWRCL